MFSTIQIAECLCDDGWVNDGDNCYFIPLPGQYFTFQEANTTCINKDASLLCLANYEETILLKVWYGCKHFVLSILALWLFYAFPSNTMCI